MNLILLKQISILSLILGAALGLITIIPYIGLISFLVCVFASGSLVLIYMKNLELVGELDTKMWAIYGSISGFIAFIGFSVSFVPLATIIGLIVKTSYYLGVSLMFRMGFFITILMVFFVALIAALMNGFGSMATSYAIRLYEEQVALQNEQNALSTAENQEKFEI